MQATIRNFLKMGSLLSGVVGYVVLRLALPKVK